MTCASQDGEVAVRLASMDALHCAGKRGVRKGDRLLAKLAKTDPDSQAMCCFACLFRLFWLVFGRFQVRREAGRSGFVGVEAFF